MNRLNRVADNPGLQAIAVVVIGLLVLSSLVVYSVLSGRSGNPNSTSTSQQASGESLDVGELIGEFIDSFNNRNLSAITRFYSNTSTVYWSGAHVPGEGRYYGSDVRYLVKFFLGGTTALHRRCVSSTHPAVRPKSCTHVALEA